MHCTDEVTVNDLEYGSVAQKFLKHINSSSFISVIFLAFTTFGMFDVTGDYGKLGHGNSSTQKYPKLVQGGLVDKVGLTQFLGSLVLGVTNELFIRVLLKNHNIANNYCTNVIKVSFCY